MVARSDVPFNVSLLLPTERHLQGLRPVRVLDIFDGAGSSNFHPDGLFSSTIFGRSGDPNRSRRYSFIDVKVSIFHPVVHRSLVALKRLYGGIIAGSEYATWNDEIKDFERSNAVDGETGFHFFLSKWRQIEFQPTKSTTREQYILLVQREQKREKGGLLHNVIVMPAGLRDVEVGNDGRVGEDEINDYYRRLRRIANTISDAAAKSGGDIVNTARYNLQRAFNELFEYIERLVEGKHKLMMSKFLGRRIQNGTRNVITAMNTSTMLLGGAGQVGFNNTIVGLYQLLKSINPVARYHLRHGAISRIFVSRDQPVRLVNKKTLAADPVELSHHHFDRWTTDEGLNKVLTSFGEENLRHKPLELEGRYLALVYKGKDGTFKIIHDINEVPEGRSREDVHPITFAELLYLSTYRILNRHPVFVTRYPVTGVGSIYPSLAFVKTTIRSERRRELGDDWAPLDESHEAYEFPIPGRAWVNSMSPHSARLVGLGADFDGDTGSGNATYTEESIEEVGKYLQTRRAYVGTDGEFAASTSTSTVDLVLFNLTGEAT